LSEEASNFDRTLLTAEKKDRPADYPGLTGETRRSASRAQFLLFQQLYWPDWRHTKIRLYQQLLEERERIVERERSRFTLGGVSPELVVYREITNGLLAAAASEFCQYAEDLAVLAKACGSDEFFARDVATSDAGKMQSAVKAWAGIDRRGAATVLRIPWCEPDPSWTETELGRAYLQGLDLAASRLSEIAMTYRQWQFHYMKYKHGLLLALRMGEVSEQLMPKYIEERRASPRGCPVALGCGDVGDAIDGVAAGKAVPGQGMIFMFGSEANDVWWNLQALTRERNVLRPVFPPFCYEVDISEFVRVGAFVSQAQLTLLRNRTRELEPDQTDSYCIPADDPAALFQVHRKPRTSPT